MSAYTEEEILLAMQAHDCSREEAEATYAELVRQAMQASKATVGLEILRTERDRLLALTDWWVLPDRTPTEEQLAYRQALRDITNHYSSIKEVVWPEKP